jgi:alpha-methylacyl-CoA racemase
MERLGLGPAQCHARNPRLVYGRMTGWGQDGPLAQSAGHDNNYIALSGALFHNGCPSQPPAAAVSLVGDVGGGLYLSIGLLAGIMNARMTGKGTVVDAAIVDASAHMLQLMLSARSRGLIADTRGDSMHDSSHFFATYRCADGEHVTIASIEPQFYALLLRKLDLQDDPLFADQWQHALWPKARARLGEIFAEHARAHWQQIFEGSDVCFGAVLSPPEAAAHAHLQARDIYFECQGVLQTAPAPRFDGRALPPGAIPMRGEHNRMVRSRLAADGAHAVWRS